MMLGLKRTGLALSLFSLNTKKHFVEEKELPTTFTSLFEHFATVAIDTDVKPIAAFLNLFTKESYNASRFDSPKVRQALSMFLQKEEYALVQCEGIYMSTYHDTVRELQPNAKLVLRAHNIEYEIWQRLTEKAHFFKKAYLSLLAKRLKAYELQAYATFDLIVAISERDKKALSLHTEVPIIICPIGIDLATDIKQEEEPPFNVFFLGSLDWQPNREGLLWFLEEIWGEIHNKFPQLPFVIAGRNPPETIKKWDGIKNISVKGEVADAHTFILQNGIMLVPILSGSGTRVKVIEAMMLGKCILSTTVGVEGISIEDKKHFYLTNTVQEFESVIYHLMLDQSKVKRVGQEAKAFAQSSYSLNEVSHMLKKYYLTMDKSERLNVKR